MKKRSLNKLIKESSDLYKKLFDNKKPNINKETKCFLKLLKPLIENIEGKVTLVFGKDDCKLYIEKEKRYLSIYLDYGYDTVLVFDKTKNQIKCNELSYNDSILENIENLFSKEFLYGC